MGLTAPTKDDSISRTGVAYPGLRSEMRDTLISRFLTPGAGEVPSIAKRLIVILVLALATHVTVRLVRFITEWILQRSRSDHSRLRLVTQQPKFNTLIHLIASGSTFVVYFIAFGLVLEEFGVNLTAYLASASIIGLAISFGSQGMVQDMVIGLTLIFSDVMDVGDMVEIFASTTVSGRVHEIGLRFTKLVNFYNQIVCIPNRTIANVSRFPHGGLDACVHIQMPSTADPAQALKLIEGVTMGVWKQFGTVILGEPMIGKVESAPEDTWKYVCVLFRIWPGQGALIETTYRQQIVKTMRSLQPDYADWQVPVTYRSHMP